MFKAKKYELVELIIPATVTGNNQQTYFQNQPQLQSISGDRRIYIKKITTYTDDDITGSPKSSGIAAATAFDLRNGALTMSIQGENAFNLVPLAEFSQLTNPGSATPYRMMDFLLKNTWRMDWTKSYIQTITAPPTVPYSYLLGVYYDYEPDFDLLTQDEIFEFFDYATRIPGYPLTVDPKSFGYGR